MPLNVRDVGALPNVFARIETARALLHNAKLTPEVRAVVESLVALAQTQHELNKRLWEAKKGSPEPHSDSHLGGLGETDDGLFGTGTPSTIVMDNAGSDGDPNLGAAAFDHEHPTKLFWEVMSITSIGF